MNRQRLKTILALVFGATLLYYDAAWAVLRCCHVDNHSAAEESLSTGYLGLHPFPPNQAPSQIDCLDFDYQLVVLAGATSPLQFQRGVAKLTPDVSGFVIPKSLNDGRRTNRLWGNFTRGSPLAEPPTSPLYLSLSSLRI